MQDEKQGIYDRIHGKMLDELGKTENEISDEITTKKNSMLGNIKGEMLGTGEDPIKHVILQIRRLALNRYQKIKDILNSYVLETISADTITDEIRDIQGISDEKQSYDTKQDKAGYEIESIMQILKKPDYELFLNFGGNAPDHDAEREYRSNEIVSFEPVYNAVQNEYDSFVQSRNLKIVAGIILTLVFSAIDWSMIYAVFQASNMTVFTSAVVAILSAVVLDVPPFILGILITQRTDKRREWYLRKDMDDPGYKREDRIMGNVARILIVAITALFISYFGLRVILFLGGGDFNLGLHMFIDRDFSFEYVEFNSSDLISTFVPFVTSAGAFASSVLLSYSKADYIQAAVAVIKTELENCIKQCKRFQAESLGRSMRITKKQHERKHSVWAIFGDGSEMPDNDTFFGKVTIGKMKQILPLYESIYKQEAAWIRGRATEMLDTVNSSFATVAMNQIQVADFKDEPAENNALDYIWVTVADKQCPNTVETIEKIQEQVKLLTDMMDKYDKNILHDGMEELDNEQAI